MFTVYLQECHCIRCQESVSPVVSAARFKDVSLLSAACKQKPVCQTDLESWRWCTIQTEMHLTQQSKISSRFVRPMTFLATVSTIGTVSLLCQQCGVITAPTLYLFAAQRKGVLDLYGEQALKAGSTASEPGDLCFIACLIRCKPALLI